ncbi:MAG: hypothetical protein A3I00_09295 [Betaproteobacteria bacterium RIFCSPLOWO2_02_FULL_64_12]|nr:MAG: hypothetical protein A3I00_09295 [Betaproteobacteria bacterium RIFCSPLOWO2_02_FULL_64_12]
MQKIERGSLMTLEAYAKQRARFRAEVMAHKKNRSVHLGGNVTVVFEDELTIRYQIQEMLHAERIFEEQGIETELQAYNPLVPDGRNFKATMMIEYIEPEERHVWLGKLIGIEDKTWIQAEGRERVWAIADEDLERETADKTSAVHFLRFELSEDMAQALKSGAALAIGIDHPQYQARNEVPSEVRSALVADLA